METFVNTPNQLEQLNQEWLEIEKRRIKKTGIPSLDYIFPDLYLGAFYLVVAPTNTGKSSFLLATAKKFAEQSKVIFWTTEEDIQDLRPYLINMRLNGQLKIITSQTLDEVEREIEDFKADYLFYDYLGSVCEAEYKELFKASTQLQQLAIKKRILIFAAAQADNSILDVPDDDPSLYRGTKYISFGKAMGNKVKGCFYMRQIGNKLYGYRNKYKGRPIPEQPVPIKYLNVETRTWEVPDFGE